jgi:hypothetical protein
MRELSFAEVRAAGLPARVQLANVIYEYQPLSDDVAVRATPGPWPCLGTPYLGTTCRMPGTGWEHKEGCPCSYCQMAG